MSTEDIEITKRANVESLNKAASEYFKKEMKLEKERTDEGEEDK